MSDFSSLKVGDTVFIPTFVRYGWNSGKQFTVKETVERLTKTLFITSSGGRFKREDGSMCGEHFYRATIEGVDQTAEMNDLNEILSISSHVDRNKDKIGIKDGFTIDEAREYKTKFDELIPNK